MRITKFSKFLVRYAALLTLAGFLALPAGSHAAGSSGFTLTPNSGSIKKDDTFTVTIHESSTVPINLAEPDIMYDPSMLQFVSFDQSTGMFADLNSTYFISNVATYSGTSAVVNLTGVLLNNGSATAPTVTGDQIVATVTFKALVGSGSTSLSFNPNTSTIQNAGVDSWNGVTTGATFQLTGDTTATTTTPTPPPPVLPKAAAKTTNVSAASPKAKPTSVTPNTSSTSSNSVPPSFFVAIKVVDGNDKPIKGASVTINGLNAVTDQNGLASFNHITAGPHTADVSYGKKHASQSITVANTGGGGGGGSGIAVQQFKVTLGTSTLATGLTLAAILLLIILIGGGGITLARHLKNQPSLGLSQPNIAPLTAGNAGGSAPVKPSAPVKVKPTTSTASSDDTTPPGQVFYPDPNVSKLTPPPEGPKDS